MKKIISIVIAFSLFVTLSLGFSINTYADDEYNIIITVGGTELEATLYDNATTRELVSRMPMTLPMMDLYGREMCYRFSDSLPTDNVHNSGYEVGDIVYWPPGHSFVIMYAQNGEVFEMQKLGYVNNGVEIFENTGDIDVRIELANSRDETTTVNTTTENTTETTTVNSITTEILSTTQVTTEEQKTVSSTEADTTENSTETTTVARRTGGSGGSSRASVSTTEITTETTTNIITSTTQEVIKNEEPTTEITTRNNDIKVSIGSKMVFVGSQSFEIDAMPYIQSETNSTLVPLRFVSIALKGDDIKNADNSENIVWDNETKTVTIIDGNKNIKFTAMSNIMEVNGSNINMENGAFAEITNGRMYVPFRAFGQALGIDVEWEQDTKTAIYKKEDIKMTNNNPSGGAFGLGEQRSFEGNKEGTFTGNVWVKPLVSAEQRSAVSNVSFAPCSRTDWHSHPSGQILLVTGGKGYVQIKGEKAEKLENGNVAEIAGGVVHWHGAAPDSYFNHIAITIDSKTDWLNPVSDEEYNLAVSENQ